ncbi:MAG: hypothetical protein ACOC5K_01385 [Chloroflexota bacterium]
MLENLARSLSGREAVPGIAPPIVLHVVGGGGWWDEIITLGILGGLVASLVVLSFMSTRTKKGRARRSRRKGRA